MSDAADIYDKLSRPPVEALKKIMGGRINGKTDINPQWRYKAMTDQFGLCGVGWKYTIDRQWIEPGDSGEKMAFVNVSVYIKKDGEWSEAIPGSGGSMLTAKEKNGMYNSDEAYKMATTDALSVALKFLGVAAAIYAGQWDGTKYIPSARLDKTESPFSPAGERTASGLRLMLEEMAAQTTAKSLMDVYIKHFNALANDKAGQSELLAQKNNMMKLVSP